MPNPKVWYVNERESTMASSSPCTHHRASVYILFLSFFCFLLHTYTSILVCWTCFPEEYLWSQGSAPSLLSYLQFFTFAFYRALLSIFAININSLCSISGCVYSIYFVFVVWPQASGIGCYIPLAGPRRLYLWQPIKIIKNISAQTSNRC